MIAQVSIGYLSFFDHLSLLWDRIGRSAAIHADLVDLFPRSTHLSSYMCQYLTTIVRFCHKALLFLARPRLQQIAAASTVTFDQDFKDFETNLDQWTVLINSTDTALTTRYITEIHIKNERALSAQRGLLSNFLRSSNDRHEERRLALLKRLSPSQDEFDFVWRREQKKGSVRWIFQHDVYRDWKGGPANTTILVTRTLGSWKTVLMANLVKDLYAISDPTTTGPLIIASFFC